MERNEFLDNLESTKDWMERENFHFRFLWEEREWEFLRKAENCEDFYELWEETRAAMYATFEESEDELA